MKTAKNLIRKALDSRKAPYIAFLEYRNAQGMESSPVQQDITNRLRTADKEVQQSRYCNQSTRDLPTLAEGDVVRVKPFQRGTKVWKKSLITSWLAQRSYVVKTPDGETYRRNRYH